MLAVVIAGVVEMVWCDSAGAYAARWVATALAAAFLVPVCIMVAGYTLPLAGPGGIAGGVLVPMLAWSARVAWRVCGRRATWAIGGADAGGVAGVCR